MSNPFDAKIKKSLSVNGKEYSYYSLPALGDARLSTDSRTTRTFTHPLLAAFPLTLGRDELCHNV
jgi:hypothetical protein